MDDFDFKGVRKNFLSYSIFVGFLLVYEPDLSKLKFFNLTLSDTITAGWINFYISLFYVYFIWRYLQEFQTEIVKLSSYAAYSFLVKGTNLDDTKNEILVRSEQLFGWQSLRPTYLGTLEKFREEDFDWAKAPFEIVFNIKGSGSKGNNLLERLTKNVDIKHRQSNSDRISVQYNFNLIRLKRFKRYFFSSYILVDRRFLLVVFPLMPFLFNSGLFVYNLISGNYTFAI